MGEELQKTKNRARGYGQARRLNECNKLQSLTQEKMRMKGRDTALVYVFEAGV
jgi:hypothetical protein